MNDDDDLDNLHNSAENEFSKASDFLARNHDNSTLKPLLLQFYGLYKQSTTGDCNTSRPGLFQLSAKAKWDAWNKLKGTSTTEAMTRYVALLTTTIPNWLESSKKESWVSVSTHSVPVENLIPDDEKLITDYIKEGDVKTFTSLLRSLNKDEINELDDSGLALIHWAADRNQMDILNELLLLLPELDINRQDSDGQTALHYASSCGHKDTVRLLLDKGADASISNEDGETPLDIAYDESIALLFKTGG